jgi:hypothetical protein
MPTAPSARSEHARRQTPVATRRGDDPEIDRVRDKLLSAGRYGDEETIRTLRAEHAALKIARYIRETVAAAPPLNAAQRDRLAALLRVDSP